MSLILKYDTYRIIDRSVWMKLAKLKLLMRFAPLLKPYKLPLLLIIALSILQLGVSLVFPWMTKIIIDQILVHKEGVWSVSQAVLVLASSLILGIVLQFARNWLSSALWTRMVADLRIRVYRHLQTLTPSYYDNVQSGGVASRVMAKKGTYYDLFEKQRSAMQTENMIIV